VKASQRNRKAVMFSCAGIALAAALAVAIASPSVSRAQAPAPPPGGPPVAGSPQSSGAPAAEAAAAAPTAPVSKTAGDAYMNVTVLKDIPANQLIPSMQFIASSLGVHCTFCHVVPHFEDDSKHEKATAREMIQMELDINKANFKGRIEVTCNTCHRGSAHPVGMPAVPEAGQLAMMTPMPAMGSGPQGMSPGGMAPGGAPGMAPGAPGGQPAGPTVDQIIDKYTQAIGGTDAISKLTTRKAAGTGTMESEGAPPQSVTIELQQELPNKRWMLTTGPNGASAQGTDGTDFWSQDAKGQVHDLEGTDLVHMQHAVDFTRILDIRKNFSQLRAVGTDQVGDKKVYVVLAAPMGGGPRERLLFDADTGLLLRYMYTAPSPLGNNPIEADFSDYRDAGNGVKLPYTVRSATAGTSLTMNFSQIQLNVPVDESKFAKPVSAPMPAPATPPASNP
jgi:photosynthetic reaction center cytochrome c subunit